MKNIQIIIFLGASVFLNMGGAKEGLKLGNISLHPSISSSFFYKDNLFFSQDNKFDDVLFVISPTIKARAEKYATTLYASYNVVIGLYEENDSDDFESHTMNGGVKVSDADQSIDFGVNYSIGGDPRGTEQSEGSNALLSRVPNEWHSFDFYASMEVGDAQGIRGGLNTKITKLEYDNNRTLTRFIDRDTFNLGGVLYYSIAPKTSLLGEVNYAIFEYQEVFSSSLDSEQWSYYTGVTWDATAKTTGSIKLGVVTKSFDVSSRNDHSDFSWLVDVKWSPKTYSHFTLALGNLISESISTGDFIKTDNVELIWDHSWNDRFNSSTRIESGNSTYGGNEREDDIVSFQIVGVYAFQKWLSVTTGYRFTDKDSNQRFGYESNMVNVSVMMAL